MSTWKPSVPPPGERDPHRVADSIDRIVRRLGGPSVASAAVVFAGWEQLVGADIAAHARPVSLHRGILTLEVDHPAWATQLRYMSGDLLERISGVSLPGRGPAEVSEIRIRVASAGGGSDPADPSGRRPVAGRRTGGRGTSSGRPESP